MFSGIVEALARIQQAILQDGCKQFTIVPAIPFHDIKLGDSIAVNGVCLTVVDFTDDFFKVTAVPETLRRTNLGALETGSQVNVERALKNDARNGGHHVQGHVDACGVITSIQPDASDAWLVTIRVPASLTKYIVSKGYITIDGMSITIIDCNETTFTVTLIPHTQAVTIAQQYHVGSHVNIEVDILGKYIEKLMGAYQHANLAHAR